MGGGNQDVSDLTLEIDGRTVALSPGERALVGRDAEALVRPSCELVSRRHLEVAYAGAAGGWVARDLGTRNGTFREGAPVASDRPVALRPGMTLMLGDPVSGAAVRVLAIGRSGSPAAAIDLTAGLSLAAGVRVVRVVDPGQPGDPDARGFATDGALTLGRAADNAIVVHDPMVSAHHARVTPRGQGQHLVEDLGSTNGTFVDGVRIERAEVGPGRVLSIGGLFLRTAAHGLVRIAQDPGGAEPGPGAPVSLSVSGVTFTVPTSKQEQAAGAGPRKALLDRISFVVPTHSLVAVIGPSGAGKSTLLKTMLGTLRADEGQVLFNGLDMAVFAGSMADRVGMVPQDDLVHPELTARQALDYAARLRFPDDTDPAERLAAVEWALRELDLVAHADTRVRQLSGGQRKRVSTAMELLTKPDLLFLDEPTSGLDPNLDREVMALLRNLAHGTPENPTGRTVVVVTHSTDNLDKVDLVLLLAPGGKVAYVGPPGGLQPFFAGRLGGDPTYPRIYALIAGQPEAAQAAFAASPWALQSAPVAGPGGDRPAASRARPRKLLPQTLTLLGRQARLMVSDRSLLLFTLALPVVVGLLTLAVQAPNGFNPAAATKAVGHPRILLVVVVFGAVLMGMVPSVRQLVGERPIFAREAGIGVRPSAYLASKVALLGVVCAIQSALMVAVALALNAHPARGVLGPLGVELFLVALAISWTCSALGLLLSGAVSTSEQVMPLMVLVLMFQLVMCGGVLVVTGPGINEASLVSPSRWGFAAGAASLDFNRSVTCQAQVLARAKEDEEVNRQAREAVDEANQEAADDAIANGLPAPEPKEADVQHTVVDCATVEDRDPLWDASPLRWAGNLLALGLWFSVYTGGAYLTLRRLARPGGGDRG